MPIRLIRQRCPSKPHKSNHEMTHTAPSSEEAGAQPDRPGLTKPPPHPMPSSKLQSRNSQMDGCNKASGGISLESKHGQQGCDLPETGQDLLRNAQLRNSSLTSSRRPSMASSIKSISPDSRDMVQQARRIIVKVSTQVISRESDGRLALSHIGNLVEQVEALVRAGRQVILVTSGATCSGKQRLKREQILNNSPLSFQGLKTADLIPRSVQRQAAAASGQSALMGLYDLMFGHMDIGVAQLLLNRQDLHHPEHTKGLRETVDYLLSINTIPIINWNDAIFTHMAPSVCYSGAPVGLDNNHLASLLADVLGADLLLLLSDKDGLQTKAGDPIPAYCPEMHAQTVDMSCRVCPAPVCKNVASKIDCAWLAAQKGIPSLILNGKGTDPAIINAVAGGLVGTLFDTAAADKLRSIQSDSLTSLESLDSSGSIPSLGTCGPGT